MVSVDDTTRAILQDAEMMLTAPRRDYLAPAEVARMFQISERTVYRLIARGALEHARIGDSLRVSVDGLRRMHQGGASSSG